MIDDLERYAEIAAALAAAENRDETLARYGLTEETWETVDDTFQARLSDAVASHQGDGMPDFVVRFSEAFNKAKERLSTGEVMSFDKFVEVTRAVHRGTDIPRALANQGVTFAAYTRANQHWMTRIARDPTLAAKLRAALSS